MEKQSTQDRFLILCTHPSSIPAQNLYRQLHPLGPVDIIVDRPPPPNQEIWVSDERARPFGHLMGHDYFPEITAWSRALCHTHDYLQRHERFWFIEEDVAGKTGLFQKLLLATQHHQADLAALEIYPKTTHPRWYWWDKAEGWFENPYRSFNPLCCLSTRLLEAIFALAEKRQRLNFHEVLFASLAVEKQYNVLDWQTLKRYKKIFGAFRWRPEISRPKAGICHPVKSAELHSRICG